MKKWLPAEIKQWLWWVFKSPQRKVIGMGTLWTDIKGRFSFWLKKSNPLEPVTICIGIKNRSEHLLNHVLPSLNQCDHQDLITLSIYDAGSNDSEDLELAIKNIWNGKFIYQKQEQIFTRSATFNKAILQADDGIVMACDADISLPLDLVKKVNRYVTKNSTWFPQVWWLNDGKNGGYFFSEGTGVFAATKSNFIQAGMYDENIREWGKEDWLLFFGFYRKGISCIRSNEPEMVHLVHQSLKPEGFVKLF